MKNLTFKTFCNKRVPVQIGYFRERTLLRLSQYLIDSHALMSPDTLPKYIIILETQARRLRTWNNFFFKKEYSHIGTCILIRVVDFCSSRKLTDLI